jgi:serine/threonine protein kinase
VYACSDERAVRLLTRNLLAFRFEHKFEDAHFEHDRIDAVAMERLTSSPHVINVFGFCGHSVITEYAEGTRVGSLADKSKKVPLARLKIARDIANGLADVHGIDGDGNATFVHLDINPANVVSIGGTLKLNDFNIGIIRRWNVTSQQPCGFPAQYPNPQVRIAACTVMTWVCPIDQCALTSFRFLLTVAIPRGSAERTEPDGEGGCLFYGAHFLPINMWP